ncbi:MAG: hypothetical protein MSJ26_07735 [Oscillospiraceae bacterium]|nr:hypothetical protein [Oscillospiraceae bacterium]
MLVSSEKANKRAEEAVYFARRHPWAKYPCLAAVSVIYSAEYIRLKLSEAGDRIREKISESSRPIGCRIASAVLSAAFAFMAVPFCEITASAEDIPAPAVTAGEQAEEGAAQTEAGSSQSVETELPKPWTQLYPRKKTAETPKEIAELVTMAGLAENDSSYRITLNIKTLKKEITADFKESPRYMEQVAEAFGKYGISCEGLNIRPVDVTVYTNEERRVLQLSEGYSADITFPIPDDMKNHLDDLKIIRLEDDGSIAILDYSLGKNTVTFNTEHFSVFALVAYKDPETPVSAENIASGAGMTASAAPDAVLSAVSPVFPEDKNRFRKKRKRTVYRIKRIAKENQLLLL